MLYENIFQDFPVYGYNNMWNTSEVLIFVVYFSGLCNFSNPLLEHSLSKTLSQHNPRQAGAAFLY